MSRIGCRLMTFSPGMISTPLTLSKTLHKQLVLFFLLLSNHERLKMRLRSITPPRATRPISGLIQNAATTSMPVVPTATFLSNGRVMVVLLTFLHEGQSAAQRELG